MFMKFVLFPLLNKPVLFLDSILWVSNKVQNPPKKKVMNFSDVLHYLAAR